MAEYPGIEPGHREPNGAIQRLRRQALRILAEGALTSGEFRRVLVRDTATWQAPANDYRCSKVLRNMRERGWADKFDGSDGRPRWGLTAAGLAEARRQADAYAAHGQGAAGPASAPTFPKG